MRINSYYVPRVDFVSTIGSDCGKSNSCFYNFRYPKSERKNRFRIMQFLQIFLYFEFDIEFDVQIAAEKNKNCY